MKLTHEGMQNPNKTNNRKASKLRRIGVSAVAALALPGGILASSQTAGASSKSPSMAHEIAKIPSIEQLTSDFASSIVNKLIKESQERHAKIKFTGEVDKAQRKLASHESDFSADLVVGGNDISIEMQGIKGTEAHPNADELRYIGITATDQETSNSRYQFTLFRTEDSWNLSVLTADAAGNTKSFGAFTTNEKLVGNNATLLTTRELDLLVSNTDAFISGGFKNVPTEVPVVQVNNGLDQIM